MNRRQLNILTKEELTAFEYACEQGLIKTTNRRCLSCRGKLNKERGKTRHVIYMRWRCGMKACRKSYSIFSNSIFDHAHLSISDVFSTIYSYAEGKTLERAAIEGNTLEKLFNCITECLKEQ